MDRTGEPSEAVSGTIDRELDLIRGAIALVASGGAPRVVIASLRLADVLLGTARRLAQEAGVRIVPLWHDDGSGPDIAVEADART